MKGTGNCLFFWELTMKPYTIRYNSKKKWTDVKILYYLEDELIYEPMLQQDEYCWNISITTNTELKHYGFILNDYFWDIDISKDFVMIDNSPFSVYGTSCDKNEFKSICIVTCKDMKSDISQPIQLCNKFNSLDKHIILWYKLVGKSRPKKDFIIGIEVTNPLQETVLLDYTVHSVNIDGTNIGFIGIPIHSQMLSGVWNYTVFTNNRILASNQFVFSNISPKLTRVDNVISIDYKI